MPQLNAAYPRLPLNFNGVSAPLNFKHRPVDIVVSNGQNDNLDRQHSNILRLTGASSAFSITGFNLPLRGVMLYVQVATSQAITIKNMMGSAAGCQIFTGTGADVTISNTPRVLRFIYDGTQRAWIYFAPKAAVSAYKYFLADGGNDYVWAVKSDLSDADLKADLYTLYHSRGYYYIAAPSANDVAYWAYNYVDTQYYDIRASQDSGATFPTDYAIDVNEFTFVFDHGKIEMDVTNGTLWHPAGAGSAGDALSFDVSTDHGQTWINTALRTIPASHFLAMFNITPRNDGSTAFVHTEYGELASPGSWDQGFIDLVDNTGAVLGTYSFTPSAIFNDPAGGPQYFGLYAIGCAKNQSNLFYGCAFNSGKLWQFDWNTSTWTLNTSYVPTQQQRQIYCSRTGTLFILETPTSSPYFVLSRSADDGATWSSITIPVTGNDTQYLPMSMTVASDNQLAIPYNKPYAMSLMTSDDDGVTWTLHSVMPSLDAQSGWVTDLSGAI